MQRADATVKGGGSTDLNLYAAMQMLGEGRTKFSVGCETNMSERQVRKCLIIFCAFSQYEDKWLRFPRNSELCKIEERYRKLGFLGCIACVDGAGWDWDVCPVAWQGL